MTSAPSELLEMGLERDAFKRAGANAYRGPCPRCGGKRHLIVFVGQEFPKWHVECSTCGFKAWADQINSALRKELTPEQRAEYAKVRECVRNKAEASRRERLEKMVRSRPWLALAKRLTEEHRAWWDSQGIPREWLEKLQIGYTSNKVYRGQDGELHHTPAYSMPYFHAGYEFVTMQYRLSNPPDPADRYRFEYGLGTSYYQVDPSVPIGENVLIVEGAKKGIVTHVHGGLRNVTVLAIPSKSDFAGVACAVSNSARVCVLLDPDAELRANLLAQEIGKKARVAKLPEKIDDFILANRADAPKLLSSALKASVHPSVRTGRTL